jgi:anaerobic ribonucleoside-triphosphate reductase activating protein
MLKHCETDIVFREFPDEVTLAVNISNCPHRCKGCHSPHLQTDCGTELTEKELEKLIEPNKNTITCVGFMGGDGDVESLVALMTWLKIKYPKLKIGWYSGFAHFSDVKKILDPETVVWLENCLDYMKMGPYIEDLGPLDSPTTNQRLYKKFPGGWESLKLYRTA